MVRFVSVIIFKTTRAYIFILLFYLWLCRYWVHLYLLCAFPSTLFTIFYWKKFHFLYFHIIIWLLSFFFFSFLRFLFRFCSCMYVYVSRVSFWLGYRLSVYPSRFLLHLVISLLMNSFYTFFGVFRSFPHSIHFSFRSPLCRPTLPLAHVPPCQEALGYRLSFLYVFFNQNLFLLFYINHLLTWLFLKYVIQFPYLSKTFCDISKILLIYLIKANI